MAAVNVWYKLVYDNENTECGVLDIEEGTTAGEVKEGLGAEYLCWEGFRARALKEDEQIDGRRGLEAIFDRALEGGEFRQKIDQYNSQG